MRKTMQNFKIGFFIAAHLVLGACGQPLPSPASAGRAIVTASQAQEAFEIVASLDYIPFRYILNGCYARSLYMAMELATHRIPSSAYYIYGDLQPGRDVYWTFHVAPLLKINAQESWVLDPSFQGAPMTPEKWISKNKARGEFSTEIKAGSAYFDEKGRTAEFNSQRLIENFAEMPAFLTSDIAAACGTLHNYISELYSSSELKTQQQTKLLARTRDMLPRLQELGKLVIDDTGSDPHSPCSEAIKL